MVYQTNFRDVERVLLGHENIQQTIRLVLENGFTATEPTLTQTMQNLWSDCPTLFNMIQQRSEQQSEEDDPTLTIIGDNEHRKPMVLGCFQPKYWTLTFGMPCAN